MASMKDIKRRKNSIQSTQQITRAMKLVATAKLQKAKAQVLEARPYFNQVHQTISSILSQTKGVQHPYVDERQGQVNLYIVITSNRGLAGGYNNNVVKMVYKHHQENSGEDAKIVAVGSKGRDALKRHGYSIAGTYNEVIEAPSYSEAKGIGRMALDLFNRGIVDHVFIAYTSFESTLSQEPKLLKLLPLDTTDFEEEEPSLTLMNFEPSPEEVLNYIIPKYINSVIYGALKESVASEHGARMTAMDSATNNASDMIDDLSLMYNRARQASITQEITEIVSGADAL